MGLLVHCLFIGIALSCHNLYTILGNAIMTLKHTDKIKIVTIRSTAFAPAETGGSAASETCKKTFQGYPKYDL